VTTRSCGHTAFRRPRTTRCRGNYSTVTTGVSTDPGSFFGGLLEPPVQGRGALPREGAEAPTGVVQPTTDVKRLPPIRCEHAAALMHSHDRKDPGLWTARGTSCELEVDFSASNPQVDRWPGDYFWTASASMSIFTDLPTRTPPVSRAWFQVRPKSSRFTSAWAVKPMRLLPHGSLAPPSKVTSSSTGRVTPLMVSSPSTTQRRSSAGVTLVAVVERRVVLGIEEVGREEVAVTLLIPGVERGDGDVDLHPGLEGVLGDVDGAADLGELALGAGDHGVADAEADVAVRGVEAVGAGDGHLGAVCDAGDRGDLGGGHGGGLLVGC